MPSLLFESNESLKVSCFNAGNETIQFTMYNNLTDSEYSQLDINLSMSELDELISWLDKQRDLFVSLKEKKKD